MLSPTAWYRGRIPGQYAAHIAVRKAIKDGTLKAPDSCDCCGTKGEHLTPHHDSYREPLNVRWLTRRCHALYHFAAKVAAR